MNIKIFQINMERDPSNMKFMALSFLGINNSDNVNPSVYDEVFSGEVECSSLEEVFAKFNMDDHPQHRGHSLSVSDVVLTEDGAYYCDSVGFKKIVFDESQAHKPDVDIAEDESQQEEGPSLSM